MYVYVIRFKPLRLALTGIYDRCHLFEVAFMNVYVGLCQLFSKPFKLTFIVLYKTYNSFSEGH